jgi:TatD DNase family protein
MLSAMLFDAHNHLQDTALAPHLGRIASSRAPQSLMVVNGTHPDDWPRVAELAATLPFVLPAYGVHPWDAGSPRLDDWLEQLASRLRTDPRASVGEIGLDRWILDPSSANSPHLQGVRRASMEEQIAVFVPQLRISAELNRAASIHCLRAFDDMLPLLRATPHAERGFLLHAYGGPAALVPELVRLGAYFSFNPSFLDPRKERQRETFRVIPGDRLLCETDAPAMIPPQTWRTHKLPPAADGSPVNHPGNIEAAYAGLAAVRGEDQAALVSRIAENFNRLFCL